MSFIPSRSRERLRIILAITAKDLLEAIKNKNTLAAILPVLFMILVYRYLPMMENRDEPPNVLVADQTESTFGLLMQDSPYLNVYLFPSIERMKLSVRDGDRPEMGLILPENIDDLLASGSQLTLKGFTVHWVTEDQAQELEFTVEEELSVLAGRKVEIEVDGESIYPEFDSSGRSSLMSIGLTFSVVMLGISFLPHLMLEEKLNQTLDALMVSPASGWELVLGKALVGLVYSMLVGVIGLAIYGPLVTQWVPAPLIYFSGSLFMISIGLFLGTVLENRQQLMLWSWVVLIPLLLPIFLVKMRGFIPDTAILMMRWIPSVGLSRSVSVAAMQAVSISDYIRELLVLVLGSIPIYGLVAWILRRRQR
ncbi:MAG: ABC transporter permease [Anaerolineales bacterium]|nr:MAG: ABC transporter permease [Anaerolineales bacterium]